jgi:uncharacterized membrane protein
VSDLDSSLRARDVAELAIGACVIAFPVAVTEEVWNLGAELSLGRSLLIALATLVVVGALVWMLFYHGQEPEDRRHFLRRVFAAYGLSLLIAALLLTGIDRLELLTDPILALKRTILVAFPASFAATAVDSLSG